MEALKLVLLIVSAGICLQIVLIPLVLFIMLKVIPKINAGLDRVEARIQTWCERRVSV